MDKIFLTILYNSLLAVPLVAAVLVFRTLTRRLPKLYIHILWILVLAELVMPPLAVSPVGLKAGWEAVSYTHLDVYKRQGVQQGLEEGILSVESNRILLAAVKELPAKYRDVIHLFYYEEMSIKEIGEVTGRKESTVTSQLTRARELLKRRLKEEYDLSLIHI